MSNLGEAVKRLRECAENKRIHACPSAANIRTVLDALAEARSRAEAAEAESVRLRTLWEKTDADDLIARAEAAEAERDALQARIDNALAVDADSRATVWMAVEANHEMRSILSTPSKETS